MRNTILGILLAVLTLNLNAQTSESGSRIRIDLDARRTLVNKKSAAIDGIRLGYALSEKQEIGVGLYTSNLFGLLNRAVDKDYLNQDASPTDAIPSRISFDYLSVFAERGLYENNRWKLTGNLQLGAGRVLIDLSRPVDGEERIQELKNLVEYSLKADVLTFDWLRLIGGVGYRHLIGGEDQVRDAFNAPIFIVGFSLDFKKLFGKDS